MTGKSDEGIEGRESCMYPEINGINTAEERSKENSFAESTVEIDEMNNSVNKRYKNYNNSTYNNVNERESAISAVDLDGNILDLVEEEVELEAAQRPNVKQERKQCVGGQEHQEQK